MDALLVAKFKQHLGITELKVSILILMDALLVVIQQNYGQGWEDVSQSLF